MNFCWLRSAANDAACAGGKVSYDERMEAWDMTVGSACTNATDFTLTVGSVTLANRADIGNNWVLTPSAGVGVDFVPVQSLEVTGTNLSWQFDRVMLVECTGTCGVSGAAASVRSLVGGGAPTTATQEAFNLWVAENSFSDAPHEPPVNQDGDGVTAADGSAVTYLTSSSKYCPGNNMDVRGIAVANTNRHQCYQKCVVNAPCDPATGDCFCDGLFQGYDDEASGALCLDLAGCKAVCSAIEDCGGIDMHQTLNRCFLNSKEAGPGDSKSCYDHYWGNTLETYSYDFHLKTTPARQLSEAPRRQLLQAVDA